MPRVFGSNCRRLLIVALAVFFGASGAQAVAEPDSRAPTATPETVVIALREAMQANDAERIRAVFHENAAQAYGAGRPNSGAVFFR